MSKEKKSGSNGTVKKLLLYMRPWWGLLIAILCLAAAGAILSVITPLYMERIVNEIQKGLAGEMDFEKISPAAWTCMFLMIAGFLCNLVQYRTAPKISQQMAGDMRTRINDKANRIPLSYFDTTPEGETLSTMTNDVDMLATSLGNTLPQLMSAIATLAGCIVLMFVTNWILALTTIGASLAGMALTFALMKKGAPYFAENQDGLASLNAVINEDFKGHQVIKAFGAEPEVLKNFHEINDGIYKSTWKSQYINFLMAPVSVFAGNLGYIAVCLVGAALALGGNIMVGTIVAFIQYAQLFSSPLSTLAQSGGQLQPAVAAGARILAMLDQAEMADTGTRELAAEHVQGAVDFEHVSFGYHPASIVLHDFSCHVSPGQKVAIVGPTGCGKSTMVNLLMRFYELNGGRIRIDGIPVNEMPREKLHSLISMVLQETWTFEGSIRDNILYGKEGVSEEQFQQVCSRTGLDSLIASFADGADAILGEESGVSAGQKQLITIARAMIDDAPILILDEATSSVDTRTEKLITQAIDSLLAGRTSFVIAHRLSTIRNADLILVLKAGDIIEMGTHDELMEKNGFYADLYRSQFES